MAGLVHRQRQLGGLGHRAQGAADAVELRAQLAEIRKRGQVPTQEVARQHHLVQPFLEDTGLLGFVEHHIEHIGQTQAHVAVGAAVQVEDPLVDLASRPDHHELHADDAVAAGALLCPFRIEADVEAMADAPAGDTATRGADGGMGALLRQRGQLGGLQRRQVRALGNLQGALPGIGLARGLVAGPLRLTLGQQTLGGGQGRRVIGRCPGAPLLQLSGKPRVQPAQQLFVTAVDARRVVVGQQLLRGAGPAQGTRDRPEATSGKKKALRLLGLSA